MTRLLRSITLSCLMFTACAAMDLPIEAPSEKLMPQSTFEWKLKTEFNNRYCKSVENYSYPDVHPYIQHISLGYFTGQGSPCFGVAIYCQGFNNDDPIKDLAKWTSLKDKFDNYNQKEFIEFRNDTLKFYSFTKDNNFQFHFKNDNHAFRQTGSQLYNTLGSKNPVNRIGDFLSFFYEENLLNDSAVDCIYQGLREWTVPYEDFRLSPDKTIEKINAQITEHTDSQKFLEIAFREILKNQNPKLQQETCWKIAQGLLSQENGVDVNAAIKFLEKIEDTTLPFYSESRSELQKLLCANNSGDGEKFKLYHKRMGVLLDVANKQNSTIQRELEEIIVPFINDDKPGGALPAELQNPEISGEYILSLLDYIRKLKNGEIK